MLAVCWHVSCVLACYLTAVAGAGVADLLDEVEDEPGRRDDHEDDEGDGDKDQRASVDVLGWTTLTHNHRHQDCQISLQVSQDLFTVHLRDHHRHRVTSTCRKRPDSKSGREPWQRPEPKPKKYQDQDQNKDQI